ncbi:amidohydrolase/deacetylase family metallohydrolase [Sporosarcina sp. ANT_H38]|uniref:amidohydrolase/deacetylase family metallohydrolase n=1 Tax=Sporosarcina sp. ANT_H38 TaxID=2597358 RepID=UPI0011F1F75E|nr:amidohydrolase/deacetylase family metallohydrolase [Sporosarcina sp. ANT_H38]KAA0965086.1 amidohydrolase/deacetylase family metallohydrolase [Sporosarcina sp. ANT_H38]
MSIIFKNAMLADGSTCDIGVREGVIVEVDTEGKGFDRVIHLQDETYVSPGWIDLHTHSFPKHKPYCANPDEIGYLTGVTTLIDAGSSGSDDIDEFYQVSTKSKTRVLSFLNISRIGLKRTDELNDLSLISQSAIVEAVNKYPAFIIGLKARMSASVVKENGIVPLRIARKIATDLQLPIMVHIGSAPPEINDVLEYLEGGDILTHCFNEKSNNHIFHNGSKSMNAVKKALDRNVYFDVGHGTASFSFEIARQAKVSNIPFHTISTDIYEGNKNEGPVFNMATTLTKLYALGHSLEEVIRSVTKTPAQIISRPELGSLDIGTIADLTFFRIEDKPIQLVDSVGTIVNHHCQIKHVAVMIGGDYIEFE